MRSIKKSIRLKNVNYEIRGNIINNVKSLEEKGIDILKLNIGNPASFNFSASHNILSSMKNNISNCQGYSDSNGLISARKAIISYYKKKGINKILTEDIYIGNGVSELILISMQALLNKGDEILVPMPDYPLWTAAINLNGGKAVHYKCLEDNNWYPDINDIKSKITKKTKGIIIINPNNPTGSLYTKDILLDIIKVAKEYKLIVFSDEIYDRLLYDDLVHTSIASLSDDIPIITFSGLSKSHMLAGFRIGWMVITGNKEMIKDYISGINTLSTMRLCSNVPGQSIIVDAINDVSETEKLLKKGGRLYQQREYIYNRLNSIDGISVTKPDAAFYIFPRMDLNKFNIRNDSEFIIELLEKKYILLVQGSGFNIDDQSHFRIVFLADYNTLKKAMDSLEDFLNEKRIRN